MSDQVLFNKVLKEDLNTFSQWRLTVNEFRGVNYLSIREYFLSFDAEWEPTKKGISVPLELVFIQNLLEGIEEILADE